MTGAAVRGNAERRVVPETVRVGVVGLGFGANVHAPAFAQVPGCKVVAIAGRDDGRAAVVASALGAAGFAGWRQMLDSIELDAISIAVPPTLQPEIVCEAAARGIAVFCEKPAAATVAAADRMLAAVTINQVTHAVNFLFPEIPAWVAARERAVGLAAKGELQRALLVWHVQTYAHRHQLTDGWKRSPDAGGGTLGNFVSHSAYYLEWLFGPIRRVLAKLRPAATSDDDAGVQADVEFDSGLSLMLDVASDRPTGPGHRLEIVGANEVLTLANAGSDYVSGFQLSSHSSVGRGGHGGHGGHEVAVLVPPLDFAGDGRVWATAQIARRFVEHLRAGTSPTPNLSHGARVQRLLDIFRASDRLQTWVEVPHGAV